MTSLCLVIFVLTETSDYFNNNTPASKVIVPSLTLATMSVLRGLQIRASRIYTLSAFVSPSFTE